jgi:hypothetical protein
VIEHVRTGEPSVPLTPERFGPGKWLVDGLVPKDDITVVFGDGGVGKSYLALSTALAGLLRRPLSNRWRVAPLERVLILDWESGLAGQRVVWLDYPRGWGRLQSTGYSVIGPCGGRSSTTSPLSAPRSPARESTW